jgi:hypothetical protein
MAGTRQTNTFGEALHKALRTFADMKVMPDADIPFIIDVETQIIAKLREPIDGAAGGGMSAVPGDPMLGQQIGMQGQMPQMPAPSGVPNLRSTPQMPGAADELRRVLTQQ